MSDIVERLRLLVPSDSSGAAFDAVNEIAALRAEVEQYDRSFDLRWDADMRAIKRWQAAHPGNDLNWPDHADLVVWLLERDAALRAENEKLRAALRNCVRLLSDLVAESGREIEYGHEDAFRMGEWFEPEDLALIEAVRALVSPAVREGE